MKSFIDEQRGYELVEGEDGTKEIKLTDKERERLEKVGEAYREENYVPVQDYVGEGYMLAPDHGSDAIAERHRDEIEQAVKQFLKEQYKTEVKVHNIVGTTEAAAVYVESIGEPHFYTSVIVPIDMENETVEVDEVWSWEGDVEQAIATGLLAMIYDEEFAVLENYLEEIISESVVIGRTIEATERAGGSNYTKSSYNLNAYLSPFKELVNFYLENPAQSKEEWKTYAADLYYEPWQLIVSIDLFMSTKGSEPDEGLLDKIAWDIEKMDGLLRAKYVINLHDNFIDRIKGRGNKENSLERGTNDTLIKE